MRRDQLDLTLFEAWLLIHNVSDQGICREDSRVRGATFRRPYFTLDANTAPRSALNASFIAWIAYGSKPSGSLAALRAALLSFWFAAIF